jgi:DNA-binding transcriptional LysR family regulator
MEQINISADDYILFVAIVEQESMVRAAEHLAMPKATVSRRLTNLEAALGQRLLLRTTRRLTLTEFGQEFLDHCRRVAEEVAATQDFVRSQEERPRGRLRVSMPGEYAMQNFSRAFATFIEAYPEIQLDLDLTSRRVDLIGERFDLAIRMGTLDNDATLVARKIDEQSFGLYASPIYLALHAAPKRPDDLEHHAALRLLSARGSPIAWKLIRGKAVWEGVPPGRITLNSLDVIQQLMLDGAGIGALPDRFVAEDVRLKRLVRVLPEWCLPAVPAWAVMPMRRYLPAKTRAFLAHIEQFIGKG